MQPTPPAPKTSILVIASLPVAQWPGQCYSLLFGSGQQTVLDAHTNELSIEFDILATSYALARVYRDLSNWEV